MKKVVDLTPKEEGRYEGFQSGGSDGRLPVPSPGAVGREVVRSGEIKAITKARGVIYRRNATR